jgi:hypothetical protein
MVSDSIQYADGDQTVAIVPVFQTCRPLIPDSGPPCNARAGGRVSADGTGSSRRAVDMNRSLLLLTDCLPTTCGLPPAQTFGGQLGRRLRQRGYTLHIDAQPMPPATDLAPHLRQLSLADYDLILIQPALTDRPNAVGSLVMSMLVPLRAHRHRTLLLTPFASPDPVRQRLTARAARRLLHLGEQTGLTVFDTGRLIGSDEAYFLPQRPARLNAVSHELLGSWLFDFYRQPPVPTLSGSPGSDRHRPG